MFAEAAPIPPEFDRYRTDEELASSMNGRPMNGFPSYEERLYLGSICSADEWDDMQTASGLHIPHGSWYVDHPKRGASATEDDALDYMPTTDNPIDPARTAAWRAQGFDITDDGLALHPLARQTLTSVAGTELRLATGLGRAWYLGPNTIGNLLLTRLNKEGVVECATIVDSKGVRKIPGGHAGRDESAAEGAVREAEEEVGLLTGFAEAGLSWDEFVAEAPNKLWVMRPVIAVDGPNTAHAWLDEHCLVIDGTHISELQKVVLKPEGTPESQQAFWSPVPELLEGTGKLRVRAHRMPLKAYVAIMNPGAMPS